MPQQRFSLTVLAAVIAGFSTLASGAQPAPGIGIGSPIIVAQTTPAPFQSEGSAGQTSAPPKADSGPKTPSLRQRERAMKAKCDAMPAGPQKDGCMREYRAYIGGIADANATPPDFQTESGAGGMGKTGGTPKTPTLRQKEQAMKAKCDAMPAGPQKDGCVREYRAYAGGIADYNGTPSEFQAQGDAGQTTAPAKK